jgi:hypothetical protein
MLRKIRILFRFFMLLLIVLTGVLIWRPDWRAAAWQKSEPLLERAAVPLLQRVEAWSRDRRQAIRPEPGAPPRPAERPEPSAEPDRQEEAQPEPTPSDTDAEPQPAPPEQRTEPAPEETEAAVGPGGNLPPRLPALRPDPPLPAALRALQAGAAANPSAATFRRLADGASAAGFPALAADAYRREAQIYRRLGDVNAALVEELKAGRYRAEGRLYLHVAEAPPASLDTGQRLEPPYGALLGAFIDRDERIGSSYTDENWQTHRDEGEFERLVGKRHASLFCYLQYGKPFPYRWAERLRDAGIIPHIAWEPRSLADVRDDAYLERFAAAAARLDAPLFIRFAGEMNGDWTPYHGDPAAYRQKFQLVYRALTRRAPKVAVIWCVNSVPAAGIDAYYPGDDAVDWVGVNLYSVLYFDNDRGRPADGVHPTDLFQTVYARYATRKPIALCEYAASTQAAVDPRPRPEFAITKMAQLYSSLPRLYPRVKLVDWFDCNNLKHARPDRQLNNYSLTAHPGVLAAYRQTIAPDYFLDSLEDRPRETVRPLRKEDSLSGVVRLSAWVRSHLDRPRVYILADDQVLYAGDTPGAAVCRWDTRQARPGSHSLRLLVLDREGRRIVDERRVIQVASS